MKKSSIAVVAVVVIAVADLIGCTPGYSDARNTFTVLPEELKDCKMFYLKGENSQGALVVRCPGSSTSIAYRSGKTNYYTAVVEEVVEEDLVVVADEDCDEN